MTTTTDPFTRLRLAMNRRHRWSMSVGDYEALCSALFDAINCGADDDIADLAHEVWAAAQLVPGEGITDGAARIEPRLRAMIGMAVAALTVERDAAVQACNEWIRENAPGGWIDSLRNKVEALQIERDAFKRECDLLTHKVITCGVAASHPDANLSHTGAYAGKWNSGQAVAVRILRTERDVALEDARVWRFISQRKAGWLRGFVAVDDDESVPDWSGIRAAAIAAQEGANHD